MTELSVVENKRSLTQLKGEERMNLAAQVHKDWSKGMTITKLSEKHQVSREAIKTLTGEWAAVMRELRPETRTAGEENMRELLAYCWDILENPDMKSVMLKMKAIESIIQIQTRFDKWFGHETPQIHLTGDVKTAADLIREYEKLQSQGHVPPEDIVVMEEAAEHE